MLIIETLNLSPSEVLPADRIVSIDGISIGRPMPNRPAGVLVESVTGSVLREDRVLTVWGTTTMFDIEVGSDTKVRVLRTNR
jgi:hypothetical protein